MVVLLCRNYKSTRYAAFFQSLKHQIQLYLGAVGQQVRKLEEWLGVPLFTRHVRRVQPTPEGLAYCARIQPALTQILQASRTLRDSQSTGVWLAMPPSLAAKWLSRRMPDFLTSHPTVTLHLSSSMTMVDFGRDKADLAVRYFDGDAVDLESVLLFPDEARVYCSPEYAERHMLSRPVDLLHATLVHDTMHQNWNEWLRRFAGLTKEQVGSIPSIHVNESLLAIEAARLGQGVALSSPALTEEESISGALVEPFGHRLPLPTGYYLVHQKRTTLRPAVQLLKDWLLVAAGR